MFERLIARLSTEPAAPPSAERVQRRQLAVAALLVEAVHADRHADVAERDAVASLLGEHFGLPEDEAERLVALAEGRFAAALDDWIFANAVRRGFDHDERVEVLGMVWEVVYSDGRLAAFEMELLQRLSDALGVDPASAETARARAFARTGLRDPDTESDA
ncbi:MAG: TerB family tellurite resistance protein [Burkholderiaceae bacterium]|nr:TerB family tellurite resistance protein [Burkholderiaceae bacterium]